MRAPFVHFWVALSRSTSFFLKRSLYDGRLQNVRFQWRAESKNWMTFYACRPKSKWDTFAHDNLGVQSRTPFYHGLVCYWSQLLDCDPLVVRSKIDWRIVTIMYSCYTVQFVDKVLLNVSWTHVIINPVCWLDPRYVVCCSHGYARAAEIGRQKFLECSIRLQCLPHHGNPKCCVTKSVNPRRTLNGLV